jgi:hypothetical protein
MRWPKTAKSTRKISWTSFVHFKSSNRATHRDGFRLYLLTPCLCPSLKNPGFFYEHLNIYLCLFIHEFSFRSRKSFPPILQQSASENFQFLSNCWNALKNFLSYFRLIHSDHISPMPKFSCFYTLTDVEFYVFTSTIA